MPYESTIPSYIWYLLAIPNEDFLVPPQNYSKFSFFVTVQAHGAVGGDWYLPCYFFLLLDKFLTSQIYEAEASLENAQFSLVSQFIKKLTLPPYFDDGMKWD